jgi:hypothetical protein
MAGSASLMMWAQRVVSKRLAPPNEVLEIKPDASIEDAQVAFHKIARVAHPDLHRNTLTPEELEILTAAYSIVAGAYQSYRAQQVSTQRMKPLKPAEVATPAAAAAASAARAVPVTPSGAAPTANAAQSMNTKAIVYYRKAELALKRGDLKSAMLQIKLAIAADPNSGFLRSALAEVELELKKG